MHDVKKQTTPNFIDHPEVDHAEPNKSLHHQV
jgi:hypothetical protein